MRMLEKTWDTIKRVLPSVTVGISRSFPMPGQSRPILVLEQEGRILCCRRFMFGLMRGNALRKSPASPTILMVYVQASNRR